MNAIIRLETRIGSRGVVPGEEGQQTNTGNRGLMLEEPLIFEIEIRMLQELICSDIPSDFVDRFGNLDREDPIGLPA